MVLVMMKKIKEKLDEVNTILTDKGYKVLYIGYFGAHNYDLNDENSDYDFKAIVLMPLIDVIKNHTISKSYETPFGLVDVKDFMTFTKNLEKGNFSYVEAIKSNYYLDFGKELIGTEVRELFKDAKVNYESVMGAIYQKYKSFDNCTNMAVKGSLLVDTKHLVHGIRLFDILQDRKKAIQNGEDYNVCFKTYKDDDVIDLSWVADNHKLPKNKFTRLELIDLKRMKMDRLEDDNFKYYKKLFFNIMLESREILEDAYDFYAVKKYFTDTVAELLKKYYGG